MTTAAQPRVPVFGDTLELEWPYRVELLPVRDLFLDPAYQRPPQEGFIARLMQSFDRSLVSTLDVATRLNDRYSVMDGVQRLEMCKRSGLATVWCAIYDDMTIEREAEFFSRRNKDRKNVHPFYLFRALLLMNDRRAQHIDTIVRSHGFKLGLSAGPDDSIAAVRSVEEAYGCSSVARTESLSPALRLIRQATFGRKGAKDSAMVAGLARFYQPFYDEEVDHDTLVELLAEVGPANLVGRAKDRTSGRASREAFSAVIAKELVLIYNRAVPRGKKLPVALIATRVRKKAAQLGDQPVTASQKRDVERRLGREGGHNV